MLYQNRSFSYLSSIQPWLIAGMLHLKGPTPKKAMRSTDSQPLKNFLHPSTASACSQEKCPFLSVKCRFFFSKNIFFLSLWDSGAPKWQPDAMMPTDVKIVTINMVLRLEFLFLSGMVQPSFTDSLFSLPSIILFHFSHASGLKHPDLMDLRASISWAMKCQTSTNSCPSPDHSDSCSAPVRLHLLK